MKAIFSTINIKRFFPKTLFARFLIIILVPTILSQTVAIYIFYQRHWNNVSGYMISNLADEILLIHNLYNKNQVELAREIANSIGIKTKIKNDEFILKSSDSDYEIDSLLEKISEKNSSLLNANYDEKGDIIIEFKMKNRVLYIEASKRKIDNPTTYIFILWMTGSTAIFSFLSIIFLRNQIKSISRLANISERFGRGRPTGNFKPSGAEEIKKAAIAFLNMRDRIEKQISGRTFMLAAVSHDLRTPLTRIKLELAMTEETKAIIDIQNDIKEMEKMIDHYLEFARGEGSEISKLTNINNMLVDIIQNYTKTEINIEFISGSDKYLFIKYNAFKRVITNILDNGIKYAKSKVLIELKEDEYFLYIEIADDGPGFKNNDKDLIFKPFYRGENARNNNSGNVGLGLAIAKDIVTNHGGDIIAEDNIPNGLKMVIKLPI